MSVKTPVYLDHGATTPMDPRVLEVLQRTQNGIYGNAASSSHAFGWAAARLVERAREQVANLIGAGVEEIVFTSGATEANNLAILGVSAAYQSNSGQMAFFALEHESVLGPMKELSRTGRPVARVGATETGIIDLDDLRKVTKDETLLVSVMVAQNEIGTVQPVTEIGRLCGGKGILLHCDAAQAVGKIPIDVSTTGIALLSISSHKIYGPKGVGALYIRRRNPRVSLHPLFFGGGQERAIRPGTVNVPGVVAFGEACELAGQEMAVESKRLTQFRNRMWSKISAELSDVFLNGSLEHRLPGNLNFSVAGVQAHRLVAGLTTLAISSSSACSSAETSPSPVLLELGVPADLAGASLRVGLGRSTNGEEVDFATDKIISTIKKLRTDT